MQHADREEVGKEIEISCKGRVCLLANVAACLASFVIPVGSQGGSAAAIFHVNFPSEKRVPSGGLLMSNANRTLVRAPLCFRHRAFNLALQTHILSFSPRSQVYC